MTTPAPWVPPPDPVLDRPRGVEWIWFFARFIPLTSLIFGGLIILLILRAFERPLCGRSRPITPAITQFVCRNTLRIIGLRFKCQGTPMRHPGAMVANHSSWLDIFVLNASARVYFVSKSEVAGWPLIGWLARATGTVFIRRKRADAKAQAQVFEDRLHAGHQLLFFPEGTSTDGKDIIAFKSTLFQAFFNDNMKPVSYIQPVTVKYKAANNAAQTFYGWWGDMAFASHFVEILKTKRQGEVTVTYHMPIKVSDYESRKTLALASENAVRAGFVV
ncbi:MAG: lysophospholipid acyltransferase family protein [Litoreibacter sp.]